MGSCIPWLLLSMQWAGPEYPTQDAELLAVLHNVNPPLINATIKWNLTQQKTSNLENTRSCWSSGHLLDTTKLNGGQQIPRSITYFTCTLYIPLINLGNISVHSDIPRIRPRSMTGRQYTKRILIQVNSLERCNSATELAQRTSQYTHQSGSIGSQCHVRIQA